MPPKQSDTFKATCMDLNLLPGPVAIGERVHDAFIRQPVSHRSRQFMADFAQTKSALCRLVNARYVEIFTGSGTLANDVVGAHLTTLTGPGIVLNNGEFGRRLVDHATRWQLAFRTLESAWGETFELDEIERTLIAHPEIDWLWTAHCETSSGVLNDIEALGALCSRHNVRLCLDCISSVGAVLVDLKNVYLASGVSGKALGSYPGLSMVFYNQPIPANPERIPRYLDIGTYAACEGVPFTMPSNLLYALGVAINSFTSDRFASIATLSAWLRAQLIARGFTVVGTAATTSPSVITIDLSPSLSSEDVGNRLEDAGCRLNYRSTYLVERNWIQLYLVGDIWTQEKLEPFLDLLASIHKS